MKLVIDAGHGGKDPGASGFGLFEKDVVLALANGVNDYLQQHYVVEILLTRETDEFVELKDRAAMANSFGADYFVSFHLNSFNGTANGFETYVWSGGVDQNTLSKQTAVHNDLMSFLKEYGVLDRGKKQADFAVLRETAMAALLIEFLFIDNAENNKLLQDPTFISKLVQATGDALANVLELAAKTPPPGPDTSGTSILGTSAASLDQAIQWAKDKSSSSTFVSIAELYFQIAPEYGVRADVAYAQAAKETAFGKFGGAIDETYHNWCGLKTAAGGSNSDPNAHMQFPDNKTGVTAHIQHLALYAGVSVPPESVVDPRHFPSIKGTAVTVEQLGGKWAPDQNYGVSIVENYLKPMIATSAPIVPKPEYSWQEEMGRNAVEYLGRMGFIDADTWADKTLDKADNWLIFSLFEKLIKQLKEKGSL